MSNGDFWARRKAGVEAEAAADARAEGVALADQRDAEVADKTDAEILAELDLPDPDSLGEGDDFKVFLTETIPARIRTRALRRLWLTNSVLANVDGLVDYGEDFTDAACVIENMQTAYQVGKGMTAHVDEMARQAAVEAEEQATDPVELAADDEPTVETDDEISPKQPEPAEIAPVVTVSGDPSAAEIHAYAAPRRMRFAFDDAGTEL